MTYRDLSAVICLVIILSFTFIPLSTADITGDPVVPGWANASTATGTHCACDAYSIQPNVTSGVEEGFVRSIRCQTYTTNISRLDVDTTYTCRCFDMEVPCGYLATTVSYQTTEADPTYCTEQGVTAEIAFAETQPICTDAFNKSCGVTAGVRTDTRTQFSNITNVGIFCRKDIVRIDCTTGICATNPDACLLNDTYSEWSQCAAIRGQCKKSRVRGIAREAINGAPACPTLAERTQYGDCTEEECALISCKYDEQRVVGPCSKACGPFGLRNVTWVNISLTQLDRCTEDFEYIIEQEEEACPGNPPCTEADLTADDDGDAIVIECMTQGNAGAGGSHPAHIRIAFDIPITLPQTGTREFASSFTVLNSFNGRRMPIKTSEIEAGDTYIILPFDVSEYDEEGATGDTYYVHFRGIPDLEFSIVGNDDVDIPPFTCLTTDESPPSLMGVYKSSDDNTLALFFSERVKSCDGDFLTGSGWDMSNMTVDTGYIEPLYEADMEETGCRHFTLEATAIGSLAKLGAIDDTAFCDMADNGNYVYDTPLQQVYLQFPGIVSRGSKFSNKLYSSNNTAGFVDRALISSTYPVSKEFLLKKSVLFLIYPHNQELDVDNSVKKLVTGVSFAESAPYDYVDRYILSFSPLRTQLPYKASQIENVDQNVYYIAFQTLDLLTDSANVKLPEGWTFVPQVATSFSAVLVNPVTVVYAHVTVGSNIMEVDMSLGDRDANSTFLTQDFVYKGVNSIISITNISSNSRTLTFNMTLNFTSEMLLTDYIYYNGTGTSSLVSSYGTSIWKGVNITTFNGTRPAVKTAAVSTRNNGTSVSSVSFTFDVPVDGDSVNTSILALASANPLITAIDVTDAIVSDDNLTVTFNLSASCSGESCFDTSGSFASMSLSGIKDVYGNKMMDYSTAAAFDLAPPTIASVIALGKRTLVFKWTEPVSFANMTNMSPKPVKCYGGGSSAVSCRFAKELKAGTRVYIKSAAGAKIYDLQGNTMLEGLEYGVDLQSVNDEKTCSNPFTDVALWQTGLIFGAAGVGVIVIGVAIRAWIQTRSIAAAMSRFYTPVASVAAD